MDQRVAMHLAVGGAARDVRRHERDKLLYYLMVEDHHAVLDVPSWDGYVAAGISNPARVTCVEPSSMVAHIAPGPTVIQALRHKMPLPDASFDRVASLAGLHHLARPRQFIDEMARVLKPGGRIAIAEVEDGSTVAEFLNGPVDKYSISGHRGTFVHHGDMSGWLEWCGFGYATEVRHDIRWRFSSCSDMATYVRGMLGLIKASVLDVDDAIHEHLEVEVDDETGGVDVLWPLLYASAVRL